MDEQSVLAQRFETHRRHLAAVAYRMLGSRGEAEDAVQEAWLRLSRADISGVDNLGGWLTTVVARLCLDTLRSRSSRREEQLAVSAEVRRPADRGVQDVDGLRPADPERETLQTESVGRALLLVLDTLAPAERVAFVLHDLFDLPFDEIAPIVGRTATAARQLASRARRRVQKAPPVAAPDRRRQRDLVDAFLAASRGGDLAGLIALLDPDVVARADRAAVQMGATAEARGAAAVAATFVGRARAAQPALVDGAPGLVWAPGGQPRVAFGFTFAAGLAGASIVAIELIADPERLREVQLADLAEPPARSEVK